MWKAGSGKATPWMDLHGDCPNYLYGKTLRAAFVNAAPIMFQNPKTGKADGVDVVINTYG